LKNHDSASYFRQGGLDRELVSSMFERGEGLTSAMYSGTTIVKIPIARPAIALPINSQRI